MALSMLLGGAECGPSNPLQGLSKRFDQDRGIQQDHFGTGRVGSSRETFRTHPPSATSDENVTRFFSSNLSPPPQLSREVVYDVSALRAALPDQLQTPAPLSHFYQQPAPTSSWAADFTSQQPSTLTPISASRINPQGDVSITANYIQRADNMLPQGNLQWNSGFLAHGSRTISNLTHMPLQQRPIIQSSQRSWDDVFSNQEKVISSSFPDHGEQEHEMVQHKVGDADELARTAGLLLENIKDEQNPKFKNSQFLGLMQKLRDRDIVVEGNQMVRNEGQTTARDAKGKGRASDMPLHVPNITTTPSTNNSFANAARQELSPYTESQSYEEDPNDAYFAQENVEYMRYWNGSDASSSSWTHGFSADLESWDRMQNDWDRFEATAIGIKHVDVYQFQDKNPYILDNSWSTHHHTLHMNGRLSLSESVLQLEAAVQQDMNNASAWFELGVKQQENERESKALQALLRAVELDPSHLPTWLALAISHTNESNRTGTYNAIRQWVDRNGRYQDAIQAYRDQYPEDHNSSMIDRYAHLIQCLINMARSNARGEVDADIQIALAVLLNSNEDYEKAQDCFRAALAVRPEDWLLYNRVGATVANSGQPEAALEYYYKALELHPGYIRARFNLGISCINLRRYDEAANHILDALVLQDNDGIRDPSGLNEKRGVTSTALWDSLKTTCLHLQRVDLATICDRKDLDAFRHSFQV